jgi:hypothetical protein
MQASGCAMSDEAAVALSAAICFLVRCQPASISKGTSLSNHWNCLSPASAFSRVVFFSSNMSFSTRLARTALNKQRGFSRVSRAVASRAFFSGPVATQAAGGIQLKELATANPYKDVVRYEHKNRKWNMQHVDYYSEALAIGLLETGLQPGDVVLSWLPPHFSESVST